MYDSYYYYFIFILFLCLGVERILHAVSVIAWHIYNATDSDVKTLSAMNVLSSVLISVWDVIASCVSVAAAAGTALLTFSWWIICITALALVCTFLHEYMPEGLEAFFAMWNNGLGAFLRATIFLPFEILYYFLWVTVPVWNAFVWMSSTKLLSTITMPAVKLEWENFLQAITAIHSLALHLALSCSSYLGTFSCLLYTSPSPRDQRGSRMPSSA